MVKIRMRRTGCKNPATYSIVAADSRSPRDGKFLEILGWYDTQIKENRLDFFWLRLIFEEFPVCHQIFFVN